ncbi:MAG: hypothetical protein IKU99_06515 [Clostridia bacterium]|nr:hypothetical protein [Clostridia bacterium]
MTTFDFGKMTTDELEERLNYLLDVEVEKNKARIQAARAAENFFETEEYALAKENQAMIHNEIFEIMEEISKRLESED